MKGVECSRIKNKEYGVRNMEQVTRSKEPGVRNKLRVYLKNFGKIFEPNVFSDICQNAAPYKHHISYGKSFKKFSGWWWWWWPV